MRVGTAKAVDRQTLIFDPDYLLTSMGAARSWVGDFFEEMLSSLTHSIRIKTDSGADICPDLWHSERTYLECKAIGQSGQAIFYKCRWEKDARFIADGATIYYAFFRHRSPVAGHETLNSLRAGLASSVERMAIVRRDTLQTILDRYPVRRINSQYQKNKSQQYAKYGEGWVFPIAKVFDVCQNIGGKNGFAYRERRFINIWADDPHHTGDLIAWGRE